MEDLKKRVEAILFSVGKYIPIEEIARLCKKEMQEVKDALRELQVDYENKKGSLVVINDGEMWKLTTREEYSHIVSRIVSETELTKSQIETLAVIAFKYPIKQSDLIRIRTNKAYDHLMELEKAGFISRKKYGRSKLIRLTDKFFEYFDLPREKLKERFMGFEQLAETIEGKEDEIERAKEEQRKRAEETRKEEEKEKKVMEGEIELGEEAAEQELEVYGEGENLEVYEKKEGVETYEGPAEEKKVEEYKEKIGELEVVDEGVKEENDESVKEENEGPDEECEEGDAEKEGKRLKSVDEVLHPKKDAESEEDKKLEAEEKASGESGTEQSVEAGPAEAMQEERKE